MPSAADGEATARELIEIARRAEKEQALVYRSLAARAESTGDADLAQRFHDLHADEQHHLSRLTARLLELRGRPADLPAGSPVEIPLGNWEGPVQQRERAEVDRYATMLEVDLDPATRALVEEILSVERQHLSVLGGKWTIA